MILLDSNIFMYAGGAPHPNKAPSLKLLARIARNEIEAAIDAEVLQEILHRYRAIRRWDDGRRVFDLARRIVPHVIPLTAEMLDAARALMDNHKELTARDALHAAACQLTGAVALCSYDDDFDEIEGFQRVEPQNLS